MHFHRLFNTHAHQYAQLILPIHGVLHIETDYKKLTVESEHLFFMPPDCAHTFTAGGSNEFLVLDISDNMVSKYDMEKMVGGKQILFDDRWKAIRYLLLREADDKKFIAYTNLALCILLWASIPVATKKILTELDNLQTLFYSTVLSTLVLAALIVFQKKIKDFKQYNKSQFGTMFFLGFLGNYLYYVLLYGALSKTTAQEGFILAYTWPMMVLVLSL